MDTTQILSLQQRQLPYVNMFDFRFTSILAKTVFEVGLDYYRVLERKIFTFNEYMRCRSFGIQSKRRFLQDDTQFINYHNLSVTQTIIFVIMRTSFNRRLGKASNLLCICSKHLLTSIAFKPQHSLFYQEIVLFISTYVSRTLLMQA